jgi:hypothetical protein
MAKNLNQVIVFGILMNSFHYALAATNEFAAGGVFLRPAGSNDYAALVSPFSPNVPDPILTPNWEAKGMDANFSAGFTLNFRHTFNQSGNDFNLSWIHLHARDDATFGVNLGPIPIQQMAGPFWAVGPNDGPTSGARGYLKSNYDVVSAEFGKQLHFEDSLYLRLFSGICGVWIHQNNTALFNGLDPVEGLFTFGITTKSKYNSGGIRFGLESDYHTWRGLSLVGLLAGNLLIGTQQPLTETSGTSNSLAAAGIGVNQQSVSHRSYVQMVPAVDAKLGLKYCHEYCPNKALSVEAGYMASMYVNVVQNYVPSTYVPASLGIVSGSVYLQSMMKTTESFSLDGPYITFALKM